MHSAFQQLNTPQPGSGARGSITLVPPPSARQSATVLIGSPEKSGAEGWEGGFGGRDAGHMSNKRWALVLGGGGPVRAALECVEEA